MSPRRGMGVASAPLVRQRRLSLGGSEAVRPQWVELLIRWRTKMAYTGRLPGSPSGRPT